MEQTGREQLQQAPRDMVDKPLDHASRPAPWTLDNTRKVQMGGQWDAGSLDVIRGYAPLARDAETARGLDWQHLRHESKEEFTGHQDDADPRRIDMFRSNTPDSPREPDLVSIPAQKENPMEYRKRGMRFDRPTKDLSFEQYSRPKIPPRDVSWETSDEESTTSSSKSMRYRQPPKQQRSVPSHGIAFGITPSRAKKNDNPSEAILAELEALRTENEQLRRRAIGTPATTQLAVPAYTGKVFHILQGKVYLDAPRWDSDAGGSHVVLRASNPVPNMGYYLERHPEIAFAIDKGYDERPPEDFRELVTTDGLYRSPRPTTQSLSLIAPAMLDAVDQLIQHIPRFDDYFPNFDLQEEIPAPYMFMYYSAPFISELLPRLDILSQDLIRQLKATIEQSHGSEYESAKLKAEQGRVTHNHLHYLFRPGDVLVSNGADGHAPQAYIATGWVQRRAAGSGNKQKKSSSKHGDRTNGGPSRKSTQYIWDIPVWYWDFDGSFAKHQTRIDIVMSLGYEEDSIRIRDLNIYPIRYADEEIRTLLEKRGKTFWSLRHRKFISYMRSEGDELYNIEDRYMVDTEAYKMICPDTKIAQQHLRNAFGAVAMALDEPPEERDVLLVVPTTIMAHNLEEKQWSELLVDRITDVTWNKQAFKDLVAEPETKELVQALVMKQLNAKRSTDFVAGKGNGLIMLLHGAPGTGKTFTAEGVAEFAEKPLLRVTCGDIGTDAEVVDQRLRATFRLGKLWDCVVLLDEADVFLEERDMKDLKRNALVSVFLRALEYYDGILILTSNRVGTFDEAFKSRIQLALHYDNLGFIQRKKIWRNFIARMKSLEESSTTDLEDILDHIDELSKEPMNGREIRNAITIARQLAQFREQCFQYSHLKHAISVGNRFSKYLKDLRMNLTDDMIKQEDGIRLAPAGLE